MVQKTTFKGAMAHLDKNEMFNNTLSNRNIIDLGTIKNTFKIKELFITLDFQPKFSCISIFQNG